MISEQQYKEVVQLYGLDKPVKPADLTNTPYLIAREVAFSILEVLQGRPRVKQFSPLNKMKNDMDKYLEKK